MMPAWHHRVPMSEHIEKSETARKLRVHATAVSQVHSFVHQLNYKMLFFLRGLGIGNV